MANEPVEIVWSEAYSVGIKEIDTQHQVLLDILNNLNHQSRDNLCEQKTLDLLWDKLEELNQYAAFHFTTEEALLQEHLPVDTATTIHISQHRQYWVSINHFKKLAREDQMNIMALVEFMNSWWIEHILKTDSMMGKKLIANGVS
jgi:hemerythrin-like metal-binding protein